MGHRPLMGRTAAVPDAQDVGSGLVAGDDELDVGPEVSGGRGVEDRCHAQNGLPAGLRAPSLFPDGQDDRRGERVGDRFGGGRFPRLCLGNLAIPPEIGHPGVGFRLRQRGVQDRLGLRQDVSAADQFLPGPPGCLGVPAQALRQRAVGQEFAPGAEDGRGQFGIRVVGEAAERLHQRGEVVPLREAAVGDQDDLLLLRAIAMAGWVDVVVAAPDDVGVQVGQFPIHKVLHQPADGEDVQRRGVDQHIRLTQARQQGRHIVLVDADAGGLRPAGEAAQAGADVQVFQIDSLRFGPGGSGPFQEGLQDTVGVPARATRTAVDGENLH